VLLKIMLFLWAKNPHSCSPKSIFSAFSSKYLHQTCIRLPSRPVGSHSASCECLAHTRRFGQFLPKTLITEACGTQACSVGWQRPVCHRPRWLVFWLFLLPTSLPRLCCDRDKQLQYSSRFVQNAKRRGVLSIAEPKSKQPINNAAFWAKFAQNAASETREKRSPDS
jgi:hypothetical protein